MTEYAEQETAGIEYTRCYQVIVDNRYGAVPQAIFHEQRVLQPDFGPVRVSAVGQIELPYDPAVVIALRDSATGEETGETITGEGLYQVIYSAYLHAALARDAAGQEEPTA